MSTKATRQHDERQRPTYRDRFMAMSDAERDAEVAQYDAEMLTIPRQKPTADERALHQAARGRGRPKVGAGARRIQVSLEAELLHRLDALSRARGLSRSMMIAHALRRTYPVGGEKYV